MRQSWRSVFFLLGGFEWWQQFYQPYLWLLYPKTYQPCRWGFEYTLSITFRGVRHLKKGITWVWHQTVSYCKTLHQEYIVRLYSIFLDSCFFFLYDIRYTYQIEWGNHHGVMANVLDCDIAITEFELWVK